MTDENNSPPTPTEARRRVEAWADEMAFGSANERAFGLTHPQWYTTEDKERIARTEQRAADLRTLLSALGDAEGRAETAEGALAGAAPALWNTARVLRAKGLREAAIAIEETARAFEATARAVLSRGEGLAESGDEIALRGTEERRPIPGFDAYFATSKGEIIGPHGRAVALVREYPRVLIQRAGEPRHQRRRYTIHALVALAFHGPRPEGCDVDHLDEDIRNNQPGNLSYVPVAKNRARSPSMGHNARKTHCPQGHAYDADNTRTNKGKRQCKTCSSERTRLRRAKDPSNV